MSAYRHEPAWQTAQAEYMADMRPGETDGQALARRIRAAEEMHRIERTYSGGDAA